MRFIVEVTDNNLFTAGELEQIIQDTLLWTPVKVKVTQINAEGLDDGLFNNSPLGY